MLLCVVLLQIIHKQVLSTRFWSFSTAAYPCMGRECFLPRHIEINGVCVHSVPLYRADTCTAINQSKEAGLVCLADTWHELDTEQARVIGSFFEFLL